MSFSLSLGLVTLNRHRKADRPRVLVTMSYLALNLTLLVGGKVGQDFACSQECEEDTRILLSVCLWLLFLFVYLVGIYLLIPHVNDLSHLPIPTIDEIKILSPVLFVFRCLYAYSHKHIIHVTCLCL